MIESAPASLTQVSSLPPTWPFSIDPIWPREILASSASSSCEWPARLRCRNRLSARRALTRYGRSCPEPIASRPHRRRRPRPGSQAATAQRVGAGEVIEPPGHADQEVAWLHFDACRELDDGVQPRHPKTSLKQADLRAMQARPFGGLGLREIRPTTRGDEVSREAAAEAGDLFFAGAHDPPPGISNSPLCGGGPDRTREATSAERLLLRPPEIAQRSLSCPAAKIGAPPSSPPIPCRSASASDTSTSQLAHVPQQLRPLGVGHRELDPQQVTGCPTGFRPGRGSSISVPVTIE